MDANIEKEIDELERFRDNALRMRCTAAAKDYQSQIDKLAMESRNKSTDGNNSKA